MALRWRALFLQQRNPRPIISTLEVMNRMHPKEVKIVTTKKRIGFTIIMEIIEIVQM